MAGGRLHPVFQRTRREREGVERRRELRPPFHPKNFRLAKLGDLGDYAVLANAKVRLTLSVPRDVPPWFCLASYLSHLAYQRGAHFGRGATDSLR